MKIAIDTSPLKERGIVQHRVRGTGFYIENLKKSLIKYYPQHKYIFFTQHQSGAGFTRGEKLPKDVDLVHYPYFEPFFLTLPILNNHKTVVTVHDLTPLVFPKEFPIGVKGKFKWEIQKRALKNADNIITDSGCSKKDIVKFTGISEEKISVVYLAAGEEFRQVQSSTLRLRPAPDGAGLRSGQEFKIQSLRNKYSLPEKFVLYVGDVTWNKNLPRLVEGIQKINVTLVMAGSALVRKEFDQFNPWNQDLLKVQKLARGDKRIIILGFVSTEDLVALYNTATVFAMPSLYEGFGLPLLEAMSCGCPVLTTKEGSIPEVAGKAAYNVDAYDTNDIANGIGEVYFNQKLQKELSQKGLMQAKKFSWKKTAENTVNVYER